MKKLYFLLLIIFGGVAASAQDFTLKNNTDHFSILQNGQGINIIGNNITDNLGNYFLKAGSMFDTTNIFHLHGLNQTVLQHPTFQYGFRSYSNDTLQTTVVQGNFTFTGTTFNIGALGSVRNGGLLFTDGIGNVSQSQSFYYNSQHGGNVGIGDIAGGLNSATLSVRSSYNLGVQLPYMTQAQRKAIPLNTGNNTDLIVYQTDGSAGYYQLQAPNDSSKWRRFLTTDDLTGGGTPSGPAGGDLSGTYPNPKVNTINNITYSYYDPTSSIQTQLNGKAIDANVVHIAGSETITGAKTFSNNSIFSNSVLLSGSSMVVTSPIIQFYAMPSGSSPLVTDISGYVTALNHVNFNAGLLVNDPTNSYTIITADANGTQMKLTMRSNMLSISPAAPYQFDGHLIYQTDQTSKGYYVYVSNYNIYNLGSWKKVIIGDLYGNIVTTNTITTASGVQLHLTQNGNWIYYLYNDDGSTTTKTATVTQDSEFNVTVTLNP